MTQTITSSSLSALMPAKKGNVTLFQIALHNALMIIGQLFQAQEAVRTGSYPVVVWLRSGSSLATSGVPRPVTGSQLVVAENPTTPAKLLLPLAMSWKALTYAWLLAMWYSLTFSGGSR